MNLLGEACQALNLTGAAERWYSLAAERQHVPAYLKYGKLLARNVSLDITTPSCNDSHHANIESGATVNH